MSGVAHCGGGPAASFSSRHIHRRLRRSVRRSLRRYTWCSSEVSGGPYCRAGTVARCRGRHRDSRDAVCILTDRDRRADLVRQIRRACSAGWRSSGARPAWAAETGQHQASLGCGAALTAAHGRPGSIPAAHTQLSTHGSGLGWAGLWRTSRGESCATSPASNRQDSDRDSPVSLLWNCRVRILRKICRKWRPGVV